MPRTHTRVTSRKEKKEDKKKIGEEQAQREEIARRSRRAFLPPFRELVKNLTHDLARGVSVFDIRQRTQEALQIKLMILRALPTRQRPWTFRELSHWFACLDSALADYSHLHRIWETDQLRDTFGGRRL